VLAASLHYPCTQADKEDVLLLFAAICAHKVFTSMSMATRFLRLGCSLPLLFVLMFPFHVLPPVAVMAAAAAGSNNPLASLVLVGLSTGTFLYVGALEVVCEEFGDHDEHPSGSPTAKQVVAATQLSTLGPLYESTERPSNSSIGKDTDNAKPQEWHPTKLVKFAVYMLGAGCLLGLTAALPKREH
jgi:hypothetical protein